MVAKPSSKRDATPVAIPVNRAEIEALPPALRDLADLLAEIAFRRMQISPVKLRQNVETLGEL